MRQKRTVSSWYKRQFCNKCIWQNNGLCPFLRCPKVKGWVADKKAEEGRENENREEITSSLCQKVLSGLSLLPYSHLYRNLEHIALIV